MANVVLEISSKLGPGGFTELKSAIDLVGQLKTAVTGFVSDMDKFVSAMTLANQKIVAYADSAARGQVDTGALAQSFNTLRIAGLEPTEEEFASLSKAATLYSQATGKDATAAMLNLTKAISTGSTRALKEFGIEIETTGDLSEKQTNAISEMENKFSDLDVELTNNTERMYALENSWGTFLATVWGKTTGGKGIVGTVLESITSALDDATRGITSMTEKTLSWQTVARSAQLTALGWAETLLEIGNSIGFVEDETVSFYKKMASSKAAAIAAGISETKTGSLESGRSTDVIGSISKNGSSSRRGGRGVTGEFDLGFDVSRAYSSALEAFSSGPEALTGEMFGITGAPGDTSLTGTGLEGGLDLIGDDPLIAAAEKMLNLKDASAEMKLEAMDLAIIFGDLSRASLEMSSELAQADIQTMTLKGTQDLLRGSLNMAFDAMIQGSGNGKKAFLALISGVLKGIAVESTIKALFEAAEAIAAFASYRYDQGAQHAIAAGLYTGVAVAAGAGAVAAGRAAREQKSAGGETGRSSAASSGSGSFSSPSSGGTQTTTVLIRLDDSAAGFDAIVQQNNAASASGRSSFQAA